MDSAQHQFCQDSNRDEQGKSHQRELTKQDGQGYPEMVVCAENGFRHMNPMRSREEARPRKSK